MWHKLVVDNFLNTESTGKSIAEGVFELNIITKSTSATVFSKFDQAQGNTTYYFSPEAEAVAIAHKASPCEKPSKTAVGKIIIGDESAFDRHFS